jgi:outer membrane protein OmpA-like peptidoglycan-associated protein
MLQPRRRFAALVLALSLAAQRARAEGAVDVELAGRAVSGQGVPRLVVHVNTPVEALGLELTRSDGAVVRRELRRPKPGRDATFDLAQPDGAFHYEGRLTARFAKGPAQPLPLSFDTALFGPPRLSVGDDAVDLTARTVALSSDRALSTVRLEVFGDDGARISESDEDVSKSKAGETLRLAWPEAEGRTVLRLSLRATDPLGYFQQVDLYPWRLDLPHEELLFASGRSDVTPGERAKLDEPLAALTAGLRRYGRLAPVVLFVAGFTDTVGDEAANRALSEARALSIARAFREAGVRLPVSYAGLGERALLVATPDETDEPRNRRATYTLAVDPPRGIAWKPLAQGPR